MFTLSHCKRNPLSCQTRYDETLEMFKQNHFDEDIDIIMYKQTKSFKMANQIIGVQSAY